MEKLLLILLLSTPMALYSQDSGSIVFEEKRQINIDFGEDSPMNDELKSMIPSSRSMEKVLFFTKEHSLYRSIERETGDENISQESGGTNISIVIKKPNNVTYQNFASNKVIEKRDFMDRVFLISDEAEKKAWKITGEQKEILGYVCQKATTVRDSSQIEAWFTAQIPVSGGPADYGGLPGLILETNRDNGKYIVTAAKINLQEKVEDKIIPPTKGKKISREAFAKIKAEKFKEMQEQYGGSGNGSSFIIKRN